MAEPTPVTLEKRCAILFGSFGFLAVGVGGYLVTQDPTRSLLYGLGSIFALGYLGYWIGYILARPAGGIVRNQSIDLDAPGPTTKPLSETTGEEVFLKQVGL